MDTRFQSGTNVGTKSTFPRKHFFRSLFSWSPLHLAELSRRNFTQMSLYTDSMRSAQREWIWAKFGAQKRIKGPPVSEGTLKLIMRAFSGTFFETWLTFPAAPLFYSLLPVPFSFSEPWEYFGSQDRVTLPNHFWLSQEEFVIRWAHIPIPSASQRGLCVMIDELIRNQLARGQFSKITLKFQDFQTKQDWRRVWVKLNSEFESFEYLQCNDDEI